MIQPNETAALILAAGRSSRMERFKPLLPINGRPLIERVIENIRQAGIEQIRVVVGYQAEEMIPILEKNGIAWVRNPNYELEMFSSIKIGMAKMNSQSRALFLQPGDMPFVHPETYQALMTCFEPEQRDMIRPCHRNRTGHPVLISYTRFDDILSYQGNGGMRTLFRKKAWKIMDLDCDDPGILIDLNIPQDYENALSASMKK